MSYRKFPEGPFVAAVLLNSRFKQRGVDHVVFYDLYEERIYLPEEIVLRAAEELSLVRTVAAEREMKEEDEFPALPTQRSIMTSSRVGFRVYLSRFATRGAS